MSASEAEGDRRGLAERLDKEALGEIIRSVGIDGRRKGP